MKRLTECFLLALLLTPAGAHAQTGTISGTVSLDGAPPAPRMLEISNNKEVCGDEIQATDALVNAGGIEYGVVVVEGLEAEVESQEYVLSNTGCMFDPPVLAVTVGSVLIVENQDDMLHNTHLNLRVGTRSRSIANWALSSRGSRVRSDRMFRRPGMVEVECDAHPWMHAVIHIFAHPYFSVTDSSGGFEIRDVPEGTHVVKVFHEVFGELQQEVTVRAGSTTSVDLVYTSTAGTALEARQW